MAKKKSTQLYEITVSIGDEVIKSTGVTALEALRSLERPNKINTKTFLRASRGGKNVELMFMPAKSKRLFYPLSQVLWAKKLDLLLQ